MKLSTAGLSWVFKAVLPLAVGCISALVAVATFRSDPSVNALEFRFAESGSEHERPAKPMDGIRLITIQRDTLSRLKVPSTFDHLPRHFHGEIIRALDRARAQNVLVDFEFDKPDPSEDILLTQDLKALRHLRATLALEFREDDSANSAVPGKLVPQGFAGHLIPSSVWPMSNAGPVRVAPVANEVLLESDELIGAYAQLLDESSGVYYPHGALSAVLQFENEDAVKTEYDTTRNELVVGSHRWALDPNKAIPIQWTALPKPFKTYEYSDFLARSQSSEFLADFKDKLVILGDERGGQLDMHKTARFGSMSGVDIVAQFVNTILQPYEGDTWLSRYSFYYCVILAALAFRLGMNGSLSKALLGIAGTVCAAIGVHVVSPLLFDQTAIVVQPLLSVVLASILALVLGRTVLARHDYRRAGSEYEATIMFLDLVSSTTLLHEMGTAAFSEMVAELQSEMEKVVRKCGGEVERTLGDGFIALFRSVGSDHHAVQALHSVPPLLELVRVKGAKYGLNLHASIGIETGFVTGGYVTEGRHRVWTSAGRTIVLAQRLQSLCGKLGVSVAVGPVTKRLCAEKMGFHFAGKEIPKGFSEEVEIFTLE